MDEEKLKSSFEKVRKDMDFLAKQLLALKEELSDIKTNFIPKSSTGNDGVPADRQTDRQTKDIQQTDVVDNSSMSVHIPAQTPAHIPAHPQQSSTKVQQTDTNSSTYEDLNELVSNLKTDLQKRFKSLTKQEFHIFSVIFTVDKTQNAVTYRDISLKTGLTESSVRDYIQKIIRKGVPIIKEKLNNKVTLLKIPEEIRNLATLDNLLRIRNQVLDSSLDAFK